MRFALDVLAEVNKIQSRGPIIVDVVGQSSPELEEIMRGVRVPHAFHGCISDHRALARIMQSADVLLSASLEDNWPNILVEADAYECKPVVGPGHGCEKLFTQIRVWKPAANYSLEAFVKAMASAVETFDPEQRERAAEATREDHSPERIG